MRPTNIVSIAAFFLAGVIFSSGCLERGRLQDSALIHLSQTSFSLSSEEQTIKVESDKNYDIERIQIDGEWILVYRMFEKDTSLYPEVSFTAKWLDVHYDSTTMIMSISTQENDTGSQREAIIYVSTHIGAGASIKITQEG